MSLILINMWLSSQTMWRWFPRIHSFPFHFDLLQLQSTTYIQPTTISLHINIKIQGSQYAVLYYTYVVSSGP